MQLMSELFNQVHSGSTILQSFVLASAFYIISCYTIFCSKLSSLILILIFVELLDAVVVFVGLFGYAASDYSTSRKVVDELKQSCKVMKFEPVQKAKNALRVMKIGFGSANFIGQTTTLVSLSFNNVRVVDLLLIKK